MKLWLRVALLLMLPAVSAAQIFDSGSDGSDGPLVYPPGLGSVVFNTQGLDIDGDGVFHFTSIDVGAGTRVLLPASASGLSIGKPVVWLSSGAVTIAGTLDLDGALGHDTLAATSPIPSVPGAGGYPGGTGGRFFSNFPASGSGPGGGRSSAGLAGGAGSYRTLGVGGTASRAGPGPTYGNAFLFPLLGGSGGGGGSAFSSHNGGGGGAGGGAILIATSTTMALQGSITARGGDGGTAGAVSARNFAGPGSGGAVRLMADTFVGTGGIEVDGGTSPASGGSGWVRLEAFTHSPGIVVMPAGALTISSPGVVIPSPTPLIGAADVDGSPVIAPPSASTLFPDVLIDNLGVSTISLVTTEIPPGTVIRLSLNAADAAFEVFSSPVAGTLVSGVATATVVLPVGVTVIDASATWIAPDPDTSPANVAIVRFSVGNQWTPPPAVPMLSAAGLAALGLLFVSLGWRVLARS